MGVILKRAPALALLCVAQSAPPDCDVPKDTLVHVSIVVEGQGKCTLAETRIGERVIETVTDPFASEERMVVEYRDRLLPVRGAKGWSVERDFVSAYGTYVAYPLPSTHVGRPKPVVSEIQGKSIQFDWDGVDSLVAVSVRNDVSPEWRARAARLLKPSFSAEFLSPKRQKSEGESWSISPVALRDLVLNPGGDVMSFTADDNAAKKPFASRRRVNRWNSIKGELGAKVTGPAGSVGGQVSIDIVGELRFDYTTPFVEGLSREAQCEEKMRIEGTAIWDEGRNRLNSIELNGTSEAVNMEDIFVETPNGMVPAELRKRGKGKTRWRVVCQYNQLDGK